MKLSYYEIYEKKNEIKIQNVILVTMQNINKILCLELFMNKINICN